ncbi:MAG TPA: stage II sporulation protein R [Candidatus Acidoferrum sp.]|nr:stage II sporulation protein R [Candidatus Acidoferrum sp.]
MKKVITIFIVAVLLAGGAGMLRSDTVTDEVIRLHILANSDSEADQAVKLAVRDSLRELAGAGLTDAENAAQAGERLVDLLPEIEQKANEALHEAGMDYRAAATLGVSHFPPKTYAGVTLPAGNYNALIVTLGEGEGHNWWCVMYPPLCYAGEEAVDAFRLSEALEAQVEYRFRIVEFLEEVRCSSLFSAGREAAEGTESSGK